MCAPSARNVQVIRGRADALKDLVGAETFGSELLGRGIRAEVV